MKPEAEKIIFAVPKGRILKEVNPLFTACGLIPEDDFYNDDSRALQFKTNLPNVEIIRVRAFDVATFVAHGAAHLGVVGSDVLDEFDYAEIYAPVDLKIGACRLSVAMKHEDATKQDNARHSHIQVATKYPHLTAKHYNKQGIQVECIKLNGAMELAPNLNLARRIVDLVSSGATLKANGLTEVEKILDVTSFLVVNRTALKTRPAEIKKWIEGFRKAVA